MKSCFCFEIKSYFKMNELKVIKLQFFKSIKLKFFLIQLVLGNLLHLTSKHSYFYPLRLLLFFICKSLF